MNSSGQQINCTPNKLNNQSLASLFKQKCKQILKKQPDIYLNSFLKDDIKTLIFDVNKFKPQNDMCFLQIMISIKEIKKIIIMQEEKIQKHNKSNNKNHQSNKQTNELIKPNQNDKNSKILNSKEKKQQKNQNLQNMIKKFHQTNKFKQFIKLISKRLQQQNQLLQSSQRIHQNSNLTSLTFKNISFNLKYIRQLTPGIQKSKYLRQLAFIKCQLTDDHMNIIKLSLAKNVSLKVLDLSYNCLQDSGGMIGKILSQHSQRRNQIIYIYKIRGLDPQFNVNQMGLCQVNIQGNKFNDKSAQDFITFLKDDQWTRSINLKNNLIQEKGIKLFVNMIKDNQTIMNLDLRGNQGLTKQCSKYIFKRLKKNMQNYKKQLINKNNTKKRSNSKNNKNKNNQSPNINQISPLKKNKILQNQQQWQFQLSQKYTHQQKQTQQIKQKSQKKSIKLQKSDKIKIISTRQNNKTPQLQLCHRLIDRKDYNKSSNNFYKDSGQLYSSTRLSNTTIKQLKNDLNSINQNLLKGQIMYRSQQQGQKNHKKIIFTDNNIKKKIQQKISLQKQQEEQCEKKLKENLKSSNQNHNHTKSFTNNINQCLKCKEMFIKMLKTEKQNIQLEIQLRKIKYQMQIKQKQYQKIIKNFNNKDLVQINIKKQNKQKQKIFNRVNQQGSKQQISKKRQRPQKKLKKVNKESENELNNNISAIKPSNIKKEQISLSRGPTHANESQQFFSRLQYIMLELSKIIQTAQLHTHTQTQNTIQNAFSQINSLSKTVSLYVDKDKRSNLQRLREMEEEILEDEAFNLEQFGNSQINNEQNSLNNNEQTT